MKTTYPDQLDYAGFDTLRAGTHKTKQGKRKKKAKPSLRKKKKRQTAKRTAVAGHWIALM